MSFVFPPFRLDLNTEQLWREDQTIALRPKTFAVLRYLVEHPEKLVTKDELLDVVWAETVVSDTVLKSCVRELRTALGDDVQNPRYIVTVHRRGYRWVAADAAPVPRSRFQVPGPRTPKNQQQLGTLNFERGTYLVGRESELRQLQAWLNKALNGERQLVFVTGEPGIGKTTLVDAFLAGTGQQGTGNGEQTAADRQRTPGTGQRRSTASLPPMPDARPPVPEVWLGWGQCIEQYGAGEAYMPILEALGRLCRTPGGEQLVALLNHHAPTWLVQLPTLLNATELEALQHKVQGATRERMLREMAEAIDIITADRPFILWLEDLHWSDPSTLELLALLARRRESARLLILGTYRPVDVIVSEHPLRTVKQELQLHGHCHELAVRLLREEAIEKYLAARVQVPSPAQAGEGQGEGLSARALANLARTIHQRTEGNPLFMVTVVDELLARGPIDNVAGEISMPTNIRAMIEQHLERLRSEEQRLLEVASVAGMEFSAAAVAAGMAATVDEVEARCTALVRRGQFLRADGTADWPDGTVTTRYGFLHALYQEVTYERIPIGRRTHFHKQIGERLEAVYGTQASEIAAELAAHFEQGRQYSKAVQYLQHAGENAVRRSAYQEAINLLRRGLELLKTLPDTSERAQQELMLQITLGASLMATTGYMPAVAMAYTRALELCRQLREPRQLFLVTSYLHTFHVQRADLLTARQLAKQLLELAQSIQLDVFLLVAHGAFGATAYLQGDFVSARAHLEQSLALHDPQRRLAYTFERDLGENFRSQLAQVLYLLGYADQAFRRSREALTLVHERARPDSLAYALIYAATLYQFSREVRTVQEQAEAGIELSREQGFSLWLAEGTILRGWALTEQGQGEEGLVQMRQGLVDLRATGSEPGQLFALRQLAEACERAGHAEEGLKVLAEALMTVDKTGVRFHEAELYRLKGELTLQQENQKAKVKGQKSKTPSTQAQAEAEACFLKAIAIAQHQQAKSWELRASTSLARLWQSQGKKKEARKLLADIYGWFTEGFDTKDLQEAQALLNTLK